MVLDQENIKKKKSNCNNNQDQEIETETKSTSSLLADRPPSMPVTVRKTSDFDIEQLRAGTKASGQSNKKVTSKSISAYICFLWWWIFGCIQNLIKSVAKKIVERRHKRVTPTLVEMNNRRKEGEENPLMEKLTQSISRSTSLLELADVQIATEPPEQLLSHPRILSQSQIVAIVKAALPTHLHWKKWERLFSSSRDGDSFQSMLFKTKGHRYSVIAVKTMQGDVFGGFVASEWHDSRTRADSFYGTGQCFLFSFVDASEGNIHVYKWSGSNMYIQLCDVAHTRLAMGGGGSFGLVVENNFGYGTSGVCDTFANKPLAKTEAFDILSFEVYGFVDVWS